MPKTRFPLIPSQPAAASARPDDSTSWRPSPVAVTRTHLAVFAGIALIYVALSVWRFRGLGLNYDEAFAGSLALKVLHPSLPLNLEYGRTTPGGPLFPVQLIFCSGALQAYWQALWFSVLTPGVAAVRLPLVLLGVAALWLTFKFTARWFSAEAGLVAAALVAVDPAFVLLIRNDLHFSAIDVCLRLLCLFCVDRIWSRSAWRHVWTLTALVLIGLWSEIEFSWFVGGLLLAVAVVGRNRWRREASDKPWLAWVALPLVCWLAFFAYVVFASEMTWALDALRRFWRVIAEFRIDEAVKRLRIVGNTLNSNLIETTYLGRALPWAWLPFAELLTPAAALYFGSRFFGREEERPGTRLAFVMYLAAFSLLLLILTPPVYSPHHVWVVYPFLHVFAAVALREAARRGAAMRRLAIALAVVYFAGAARVWTVFNAAVAAGEVRITWSREISSAADYLRAEGRPAVFADWGLAHNLAVLTGGRVPLDEPYCDRVTGFRYDGHRAIWQGYLADPRRLYVLHAPERTLYRAGRADFFAILGENGRKAVPVKTFQHEGAPFIEIYEAVPA